jgi:glycosyltransferase involved in cell wall biosynthesis
MKIAVVSPMENALPPKGYGGVELVVANLVNELVDQGHDVTLYASGDSKTKAKLFPCVPKAVNKMPGHENLQLKNLMGFDVLIKAAMDINTKDFDIVHNHFEWPFLLFRDFIDKPVVTTVHITLDERIAKESHDTYNFSTFRKSPLITVSKAMQSLAPKLNFVGNVYNGIDIDKYSFNDQPGEYLAFLGRMSPQKGPIEAIQVAKATGRKLIMAARVGVENKAYYEEHVVPLIDGEQIVFLGEVEMAGKNELLRGAKALLFPIAWEEPFGLAVVEAMACGTPVIALNKGSMSELIEDGKNGYLCNNIEEMVQAVERADRLDRAYCRRYVEKNFTVAKMTKDYLKIYDKVIKQYHQAHK